MEMCIYVIVRHWKMCTQTIYITYVCVFIKLTGTESVYSDSERERPLVCGFPYDYPRTDGRLNFLWKKRAHKCIMLLWLTDNMGLSAQGVQYKF